MADYSENNLEKEDKDKKKSKKYEKGLEERLERRIEHDFLNRFDGSEQYGYIGH